MYCHMLSKSVSIFSRYGNFQSLQKCSKLVKKIAKTDIASKNISKINYKNLDDRYETYMAYKQITGDYIPDEILNEVYHLLEDDIDNIDESYEKKMAYDHAMCKYK